MLISIYRISWNRFSRSTKRPSRIGTHPLGQNIKQAPPRISAPPPLLLPAPIAFLEEEYKENFFLLALN